MEFTTFVRKPFVVEAVEVTLENIEEIAELVGTLKYKDNKPYIQVNRLLVPNIYRVFPGFWMTRMNDNIRCYTKRIFPEQFIESTPEIAAWVEYLNHNGDETQGGVPSLIDEPEVENFELDPDVEIDEDEDDGETVFTDMNGIRLTTD